MTQTQELTTTQQVVRAGFSEAAVLIVGGVIVGGIGGFWGAATGGPIPDIASDAAKPYLVLVAVLPALLVLLNFSPPKLAYFETLARGLTVGGIAGGVGGVIAALGYFVPAANLPIILRGKNANDMYDALRSEVGLTRFLIVVVVSLVAGLAAGALTHYRVAAYQRQQQG